MSSDGTKKPSDDKKKLPEDIKKSYSSRVNFMVQEASKLEVSGISQLYNCVRQRMMDVGLLEDNRNLRNSIDAPWLDDEAIQLKLCYQEAVSLWTTWPTSACAERIKSIRQQLNTKLLDLRQKWEEKINNCRTMDSRNAEKVLKLNAAQYKELLLFASGHKQQHQQNNGPPYCSMPVSSSSNKRSHHNYHPYDLNRNHHYHRHQRHHYQDSLNIPRTMMKQSDCQPFSYYIPNDMNMTPQDNRRIHGVEYQNYFHQS
ncbi:unnamed protein product [Schistosoma rodhaini]|uniref:CUPID domain-containing protein n=1 Tax=Schistosoma rodhaini TaxID=6188 RepID=A0AA85GAF8_9TREM|nr:unnamed protein product [Schistosoma rodhaini]